MNTFQKETQSNKEHIFPRFLIVASKDDQPIKRLIFGIQKLLKCAVAKKLCNGNVLIEVESKSQEDNILAMNTWVDKAITVTSHRSPNTSRGIIRYHDFHECDESEVIEALSNQGITEVKRNLSKTNGMIKRTNTFILTFGLPTPPKSVKVAYLKLSNDQYVPNPLRCYNCQRFGHGKSNCKRKAICAKCSQEGHSDCECKNKPHCANCAGNHCAYSKECVEWIKQKVITHV